MRNVILPLCLVIVFFASFTYAYLILRDDFFFKNSRDLSVNLKNIVVNSVLSKYSNLLTHSPSSTASSMLYMGRLVKLKAELLQMLSSLEDVRLIIYNQDCKIIFSENSISQQEINDHSNDASYRHLNLSEHEISLLSSNNEVLYRNGYEMIAIFPIIITNFENKESKLFIKVIHDYGEVSTFFTNIYLLLTIVVVLLVIFVVIFLYYRYSKNNQILISQHEINLQLQKAKEDAEIESLSKSTFLANVSHELRTPLNAIIGFSEIMKNACIVPANSEQYREYASDIYNSGNHLLSLINDILDFSKAEANKLTVESIKFDLNKLIESCIRMVKPKADAAGLVLEQVDPAEHIVMTADPRRLKQVIINILSNSIKFTLEGGKVIIRSEQNEEIIIEISDTGIGIEQQEICHAMSVFGQADSNNSRKYEGTGLGLPLSKKLIELMGGGFKLTSEFGVGTTVIIRFPLREQYIDNQIF